MIVHEDERRIIYDWANGSFKSAKAAIIKTKLAVGDHYHNNKDEEFLLLDGEFLELWLNKEVFYNIKAPYKVSVPRGTYHKFICSPGSILLGTATELFDPLDEIKKTNI